MNIFWLCNVELPIISESKGIVPIVFGGWLDQVSRFLAVNNNMDVCYMSENDSRGGFDNIRYYGFKEENSETTLKEIIKNNDYDLFHIWGTEYPHSCYCLRILRDLDLLDKAVVSIQGLVSVYKRYYLDGIPDTIINKKNRIGFFSYTSIANDYDSFSSMSQYEIETLKLTRNVIGRTDWDKKCVYSINPKVHYYKCNENLRACFYNGAWNVEKIDRHSIFVSQFSYPIKGIHYILNALSIIIRSYPDTKIVFTGKNIIKENDFTDSYWRYLAQLIKEYDLVDHIVFKGLLSDEEMKKQYLRANVFLSASTIENSPNSIGEAMILGCPVVSSYVGGVMDLIDHKKEGLLFQSGSIETMAGFIMDIFSDDDLARQLSKNSRERARITHDVMKNNSDLLGIYNELMQ